MKYLTNSGLSYFFNKIKAYLTSSTYLNSIGISNSEIDNIADNEGYSSGSLPASEDVFLTGDIIPNTDNSIDLGASSKNIKMIYTKGITINGTQFLPSDYIPKAGGAVFSGTDYSRIVNDSYLYISGGTTTSNGGVLELYGKDHTLYAGYVSLKAKDSSNASQMVIRPTGAFMLFVNGTAKNVAMQEDVVPRSGGCVITGKSLSRIDDTNELRLDGGISWAHGGSVAVIGKDNQINAGCVGFFPHDGTTYKGMFLKPDGTWIWNGTACQVTSDQRLKQQIAKIDNDLLNAWEDVTLCQFKYNDAVNEKGNQARLHTGYVVQQINEACQKHNIDISAYGLYCHEEYPERTEEVTIENEDGTTTKETRVVEPAKEHYSLRYTETLVVECAYLRKKIKELEERLDKLELQ